MKGLAPHTLQVFEAVSKLDCIKSYLLVGGTALSLQMGTRQSEDLDFMKWRTSKTEKMEVAWYQIEKELAVIGDILQFNQILTCLLWSHCDAFARIQLFQDLWKRLF